jgi:VCBS repeat-containing protein
MKIIQNKFNNAQFSNVGQSRQKQERQVSPAGIVRRKSQLLALEARIMFDGAAVADMAHQMADVNAQAVPEMDAGSLPAADVSHGVDSRLSPEALVTQMQAQRLVNDFFSTPDALQKLFTMFNGGLSEPSKEWLQAANSFLDALRQGDAWCNVELRSNGELHGASGAFSARGSDGKAVIYLNADWLNSGASERSVLAVIAEEIGHSIDAKINGSHDTPGDEGQRFAASLLNFNQSMPGFAQDNDHRDLQIDGVNVEVELANYTFINAYRVNVATTPAGKESNTHDIIFTSLGLTMVNDDTNSELFSGNDVSAVGLNIGGVDYYGWISRPIKVGGVVKAFYFWYDVNFANLTMAQADGNQDGDGNAADNSGFILVVDQSYFDNLGFVGGLVNIKNVGSSSDRVDSALNALITDNAKPVAVADSATAVEKGGVANASGGSNASGNVLTNDTDSTVSDTKTLTKVGTSSANQTVASNTSSTNNGTVVNGQYGDLTIGADGSFQFVINDNAATVQALRINANTLTDTFTYTMVDKAGSTSTTTLTVTIQGANDNPVASNDYNTAKESLLTDGTAYSGTDLLGAKATGNVLGNDTDVDKNGEAKTVGNLAGSLTIGSYTTATGTAQLTFLAASTLSPVGSGDEAWYKISSTDYRAIFTAQTGGIQVAASGSFNTTTLEMPLNGTPAYYYTPGGRVAIGDLNNITIGFKNDASTTTYGGGGGLKEGIVSSTVPANTSTIVLRES